VKSDVDQKADILPSGAFVLARVLPESKAFNLLDGAAHEQLQVLGFLPLTSEDLAGGLTKQELDDAAVPATFLVSANTLRFSPDHSTSSIALASESNIANVAGQPNTAQYSLVMKQENPVWHAPESYFVAREMAVPAAGSSERFLHSALGSRAFFLKPISPGTPAEAELVIVHNGDFLLQDVPNVRIIEGQELEKLYSLSELGQILAFE
jgi:hypothetical protein